MKGLQSKLILAPVEKLFCFSGDKPTVQKAALLLFSFTVICSTCTQKHKICPFRQTDYFMLNWKHLRSDCLGGSDLSWCQMTATVTLKNSSAAWSTNLIMFQQSRVTAAAILVTGQLYSSSDPNRGRDGVGTRASLLTGKPRSCWGLYTLPPHLLLQLD